MGRVKEIEARVGLCQRLYREGQSLDKIATEIGRSRATIFINVLGF